MKEDIEEIQNKKYFKDINEAIKVYEEFRRYKNDGFIDSIDPDFFFNLIDVIILEHKRVLKENEECKLDVQDYLKQAQENAEIYRKAQKEIQDLKVENEELKRLLNGNLYENYKYYKNLAGEYQGNCISKQKINDKIEELKSYKGLVIYERCNYESQIKTLQELLESEGK